MSIIIPKTREEWLQERRNGIGASDAGTIIGVNPWKTNVKLWAEKTGRREPEDISAKPYVQYGHQAEQHIRALFTLDHPELQVIYESPYKIIRSDAHPFIFCTPDGELTECRQAESEGYYIMRKGGLEIKTTEIMNSRQWAEWNGRIPDQYYAQVCHQMLAAGWEFVWLRAQIKFTTRDGEKRAETRDYKIERKEIEEDLKELLEAERNFWMLVQEGICPPLRLPEI
jgi:putative phage-type endonuclease